MLEGKRLVEMWLLARCTKSMCIILHQSGFSRLGRHAIGTDVQYALKALMDDRPRYLCIVIIPVWALAHIAYLLLFWQTSEAWDTLRGLFILSQTSRTNTTDPN